MAENEKETVEETAPEAAAAAVEPEPATEPAEENAPTEEPAAEAEVEAEAPTEALPERPAPKAKAKPKAEPALKAKAEPKPKPKAKAEAKPKAAKKPARKAAERKKIVRLPKPEGERGRRKERRGIVVSNAMDKTIVVRVDTAAPHPRYKKVVRRSTKFHAHDEGNVAKPGDFVRIVETRPLSATKHWRLAEVLEEAR